MSDTELVLYFALLQHARARLCELASRPELERLLQNLIAELLLTGLLLPSVEPNNRCGPVTDLSALVTDSDAVMHCFPRAHVPEQCAAFLERGMDRPLSGIVKAVYDLVLRPLEDSVCRLWRHVGASVVAVTGSLQADTCVTVMFTNRNCREVRDR